MSSIDGGGPRRSPSVGTSVSMSSTDFSTDSALDSSGSKLSGFEYVETINTTDVSVIKKVRRIADGKFYALKQVPLANLTQDMLRRVREEAPILKRMKHPNIIAYKDHFEEDGVLNLVMELAQGDLRRMIAGQLETGRMFDEIDIWSNIYSIASALAAIHAQSIIHRDLKPENVLIIARSGRGTVKLADLSLGRVMQNPDGHAQSLVGTPSYMSPEALNEKPYTVATDVWALGCVAYELCTLTAPFRAGSLYELLQRIFKDDPAPISPHYTPELRDLVFSMLAKSPERRPQAAAVAERARRVMIRAVGYDEIRTIASGQDQTVVKEVVLRHTGEHVALKVVSLAGLDSDAKAEREFMTEATLLMFLPPHPTLITCYDAYRQGNDLVLMMELASGGDLHQLLQRCRASGRWLSELEVWYYFAQIADAVAFVHRHRVIHRDVKPSNVFLMLDGAAKLGDLGLGRFFPISSEAAVSLVGTPLYMAPETLAKTGHDFSADVWSLGCLLYELCAREPPFNVSSPLVFRSRVMSGYYEPLPDGYSPEMSSLVHNMLLPTATDRPTADQVRHASRDLFRRHFEYSTSVNDQVANGLGRGAVAHLLSD